jgi:hypothetical protein
MSKSISSREAGQSRRRRKENKAVVLCESLRLGRQLTDLREIVHFFTASEEGNLKSKSPSFVKEGGRRW